MPALFVRPPVIWLLTALALPAIQNNPIAHQTIAHTLQCATKSPASSAPSPMPGSRQLHLHQLSQTIRQLVNARDASALVEGADSILSASGDATDTSDTLDFV